MKPPLRRLFLCLDFDESVRWIGTGELPEFTLARAGGFLKCRRRSAQPTTDLFLLKDFQIASPLQN